MTDNKKKRFYTTSVLLILITVTAASFIIRQNTHNSSTQAFGEVDGGMLSSHSALMVDLDAGKICYTKNADERMPIASLTKIMTALTAIENIHDLDSRYSFSEDTLRRMEQANASVAGFAAGERVSVRDLLYGIMLPSGGDAALGIAGYVAGDEESFVAMMNGRAAEIGMRDTRFSDVTGLDDTGNYSTASDMALLFSRALENPVFFEIVTADQYLTTATEQHKNGILLQSTLTEPMKQYALEGKILGGKTGYTTGAGLCLASYAEVKGHRYILVTLGAGDGSKYPSYHFEDAAILYDEYYMT